MAIQIDQVGLAPGVPGVSRTDGLPTGALVTLTNTGPGTTLFSLPWVPPGDATARPSLAVTGNPKVWTFAPTPGKYGSYLVELVENGVHRRAVLAVRTPGLGLVIPALNERGNRLATLDAPGPADDVDNYSTDSPDPDLASLPFGGWWRAMHELITAADAVAVRRGARVTEYAPSGIKTRNHPSLGLALGAALPPGTSAAVYEIAPNVGEPLPAPVTLDPLVAYVLRPTRSSLPLGAGVRLPAMTWAASPIRIEDCAPSGPLAGATLELISCSVLAGTIAARTVTARDCAFGPSSQLAFAPAPATATFDRCAFGAGLGLASSVGGTFTFTGCTFGLAPNAQFTGPFGVLRMDAASNLAWVAAGGTVTNGFIIGI